eukprot:GFYU01004206.1.p1 GENE.GFYU01004206.1~~GFYU01004206.1.p1  ORF type:complete len:451 (-),score=140.41 GFYU01004206.1:245-1597(-)
MPPQDMTADAVPITILGTKSSYAIGGASEECVIFIHGKCYDVTKWVADHPGGDILLKYHLKDATDAFTAFHAKDTWRMLTAYEIKSSDARFDTYKSQMPNTEDSTLLKNFRAFRKELEGEGWFKPSPNFYTFKLAQMVGLLAAAVYFVQTDYYLVGSILLGLFWQQMGWVGHEVAHHQVFTKHRGMGNTLNIVMACVASGFSATWWKDRHNSHHAATNVLDVDPDVDNLPLFVWDEMDLKRVKGNRMKKVLKFQSWYFLPFTPTLRSIWCLQSWLYVQYMFTCTNSDYRGRAMAEFVGLILHYVWKVGLLFFLPTWWSIIPHMMISEGLGGFGIAIVVFFNHYACDKIESAVDHDMNWSSIQLMTTRNMTPGVITDWLCGGLNYQIEHHLFPTIPRNKLAALSHRVKAWCKQNNLEYMCEDFHTGVGLLLKHLQTIADQIELDEDKVKVA